MTEHDSHLEHQSEEQAPSAAMINELRFDINPDNELLALHAQHPNFNWKRLYHQAAEIWDQNNRFLRDILGEERFNQIRQQQLQWYIKMLAQIQEYRERLMDALTDRVTGLAHRGEFFKELKDLITEEDHQTKEILKLSEWSKMSNEEFSAHLESLSSEQFQNVPITVVMSDVSFLSFVNQAGHSLGDELLRQIGKQAQEVGSPSAREYLDQALEGEKTPYKFLAFRHSGDEITAIVRMSENQQPQIEEQLARWSKAVEAINLNNNPDEPDILQRHRLKPHIDLGFAPISWAVQGFKDYVRELKNLGMILEPQQRAREFYDLWLEIADYSAAFHKAKERVLQLIQIRQQSRELYEKLITTLAKGAQIPTQEIVELSEQMGRHGVDDPAIIAEIDRRIQQFLQREAQKLDNQKRIIASRLISSLLRKRFESQLLAY